ncbi:MAG: hypothetical protein DSY37_00535 [Hyperthermus sp.]|nr:MAG: hypothetical protein DSY37_00535 [Hyperthermus sp.]
MPSKVVLVIREKHTKTITVEARVSGECRLEDVKITGDFFIYPPEALEEYERLLRGCENAECYLNAAAIMERTAEAIGFDWRLVSERIIKALERYCSPGQGR